MMSNSVGLQALVTLEEQEWHCWSSGGRVAIDHRTKVAAEACPDLGGVQGLKEQLFQWFLTNQSIGQLLSQQRGQCALKAGMRPIPLQRRSQQGLSFSKENELVAEF